MRKKLYELFNKIYGILMSISFFAGFIPVIPFLFAIIIGGEWGEKIALFFYKQYYPWVILMGSLAIVIGLISMYIGKLEGLSVKNANVKEKV